MPNPLDKRRKTPTPADSDVNTLTSPSPGAKASEVQLYSYDPTQREKLEPQLQKLGYTLPEDPNPSSQAFQDLVEELRVSNPALAAAVHGMVRDRTMDETNAVLKVYDQNARRSGLPREQLRRFFMKRNAQGEEVFNKQMALTAGALVAGALFLAVFFSGTDSSPKKKAALQPGSSTSGTSTVRGRPALAVAGTSSASDAPPINPGDVGTLGTTVTGGAATAGISSVAPARSNAAPSSGVSVAASPLGAPPSTAQVPVGAGSATPPPPSFDTAPSAPVFVPSAAPRTPTPTPSQNGTAGMPVPLVRQTAPAAQAMPVQVSTIPTDLPSQSPTGAAAFTQQPSAKLPPPPVTVAVLRTSRSSLGGAGSTGSAGQTDVVYRKSDVAALAVVRSATGPVNGGAQASSPDAERSAIAGAQGSTARGGLLVYLAPPHAASTTTVLPTSVNSSVAGPAGTAGVSAVPVGAPVSETTPASPVATVTPPGVVATPPQATAAPAAPSPYHLGQRVLATLTTGINVAQGASTLPVYATTEDGTLWRGTVSLDLAKRVNIFFDRALLRDGTEVVVTASAYNLDGTPGLKAQYRDIAPTLANDLIRAAVSGVKDFVDATIQATTTTTNGSTAVVQRTAPSILQSVAGSASGIFQLPPNQNTFVTVAQLPVGAQFALVYGPISTQGSFGQ